MKSTLSLISTHSILPDFFDGDFWQAQSLGFQPDTVHSTYHLKFNHLQPMWLKQAVKQFILFQSATKSFGTCRSYIIGLAHFGHFMTALHPTILPQTVNRKLITDFFYYLKQQNLSANTRQIILIHLRTFHQLCIQEKWLDWPSQPLIYNADLPNPHDHFPRYIPETVISQLQTHLHHLSLFYRNIIMVLLETGRRISEICPLPFSCLEQDQEDDYFLKIDDRKLKKSYLIPISPSCLEAIKSQQALVISGNYQNQTYLFPAKVAVRTPHVGARYINKLLNKLAEEHQIVDTNNQLWHFHAHQFRHTAGTRMINAGVPQAVVQKYLGHESPEMTSRYAHIHQETLKTAFYRYQETVDIQGTLYPREPEQSIREAKWLKHNIMAQALPNGLCSLPAPQSKCPHANACLSCVHFRTTKEFLPTHQEQLQKTNQIIQHAKANGWQRQVEMNEAVKGRLENIIESLEKTA